MRTEQDRQILLYITGLCAGPEQHYAAAFAHWLIVTHGDTYRAMEESASRATGVTKARAMKIRTELIRRGIC